MRTTVIVAISLPPEMVAEPERVQREEHRTRSELVREAFRKYLEARPLHHSASAEAREMGERLLTLFSFLRQPYPGEHEKDATAPAQTPPTVF